MRTLRLLRAVPLALPGLLTLAFASAALGKGPPWISVEIPPNPLDPETRGAVLVVHTYHHGRVAAFPVSGTAEGIVNGERKSVRLELTRTSRPGVYALSRQWPSDGAWVLVIQVTGASGSNGATALVELGSSGEVAAVRVPTTALEGRPFPRKVTREEIDATLRAHALRLAGAPTSRI